jgi:hypothetical protein
MKFSPGQSLLLLENMKFNGGGKAQPMASALITGYNETSNLYRISYEVYGTGERGEIEVPEDRLYSPSQEFIAER